MAKEEIHHDIIVGEITKDAINHLPTDNLWYKESIAQALHQRFWTQPDLEDPRISASPKLI